MPMKLKQTLAGGELIQAPGVYDALTAKIAEAGGFNAVYMTGYGTTAAHFAYPDIGLLTMTEMVENARRIAAVVQVPLIADADTGYGNPINVVRTVREFEKAGAAAIHIEDQVWPKRCGHMAGKQIIPASDMVGKIKAAVDARRDEDFLIIARTDALATDGFEHAIERGHLFAEAGADILFIEAPVSREQVEEIPRRITGKPLLLNLAPRTPNFSSKEINDMGYAIAIYPGICIAGAVAGCIDEIKRLKETGSQRNLMDFMQAFVEMNNFLGVQYYADLERTYKEDAGQS